MFNAFHNKLIKYENVYVNIDLKTAEYIAKKQLIWKLVQFFVAKHQENLNFIRYY